MSDQQQPTVDRPTEADMQVDLRDCLANFGEWFPAVRGPISQAAVERTKAILRRALYAEAILNAPRVMLFADGREPTKNERHLFNLLTWAQHECRKQKEPTPLARLEAWANRHDAWPKLCLFWVQLEHPNRTPPDVVAYRCPSEERDYHAKEMGTATVAAGTDEQPATLDEMILAALAKWEELYG